MSNCSLYYIVFNWCRPN